MYIVLSWIRKEFYESVQIKLRTCKIKKRTYKGVGNNFTAEKCDILTELSRTLPYGLYFKTEVSRV